MSDISMHGYAEGRWRTKGGMDTLSTDVFTYRSVSRSSFFRFGEYFTDPVLPSAIPFYYSIKLLFLAWLMLPQYRGALTVYAQFVAPYLRSHEKQIDTALENATKEVVRRGSAIKDQGMDWLDRKKQEASDYLKQEATNQLTRNSNSSVEG